MKTTFHFQKMEGMSGYMFTALKNLEGFKEAIYAENILCDNPKEHMAAFTKRARGKISELLKKRGL